MLPYILTTPFEVRKYLGCLQEKRGKFQMLCSGASEQLREGAGLPVWAFIKPEEPEKIIKSLVDFSWCSFWSSVSWPLEEALSSSNPLVDKMHYFIFHGRKKINKFMS